MSDQTEMVPETPGIEDLVARIEKSTPKIFARLRSALGVEDKAGAIQLVRTDS